MKKYTLFPKIDIRDRSWPSKIIEKTPIWCNVDLRDGNQALVSPMNPSKKLKWFYTITSIGFKEIEVSFPSASQQEFDFTRILIEENHIPEDVTIQVLTQARKHLIHKTFDAIRGVKKAIVHLYNSTSPTQRKKVFRKNCNEIINIATEGVKLIRELSNQTESEIILEYSPESFSQTELSFAADICNAVIETWSPSPSEQIIINLPSTVEVASPHIYADQIEYMVRQFKKHKNVIISVHTHNDRGCAVAAAELAQCAGATRVEGTIFGNGERTGNADIVTLALNCTSQGIDTNLDFSNIPEICSQYTECTGMTIPSRQPYAGDLVFSAFSGSHQDAISKSLASYTAAESRWDIPYLPIDPSDIGRSYKSVIRINSQSGKGGAAYILEQNYGFQLPHEMQCDFREIIKKATSINNIELNPEDVYSIFSKTYINVTGPFKIRNIEYQFGIIESPFGHICIENSGNNFLDNIRQSINKYGFDIKNYSANDRFLKKFQKNIKTVCIQLVNNNGYMQFGASSDNDSTTASVKALCNALNRTYG